MKNPKKVSIKNDEKVNLSGEMKMYFDLLKEHMNNNFKIMGEGFDGMNQRFDRIESDIDDLKKDMTIVKTDVRIIKSDLNNKVERYEFDALSRRVSAVEKKVLK